MKIYRVTLSGGLIELVTHARTADEAARIAQRAFPGTTALVVEEA